jgi:hypothetical protein
MQEREREPGGVLARMKRARRGRCGCSSEQRSEEPDHDHDHSADLSSLLGLPPFLDVPVEYARHVDLSRSDLVAQEAHVVDDCRQRRLRVPQLLPKKLDRLSTWILEHDISAKPQAHLGDPQVEDEG